MIDTGDPDERPGTRLSGATGSSGDVEETLAAVTLDAFAERGWPGGWVVHVCISKL